VLKRTGVTFNLSCRVLGIEDGAVRYEDGSGEEKTYAADRILNATGRAPVVQGLGLEEAGVDFSAKGVRVNDQGKTTYPACGHAVTSPASTCWPTWPPAKDRGRQFNVRRAGSDPLRRHPRRHLYASRGGHRGRTEEQLKASGIAYKKAMVPMGVAGRFLIENEKGTGFVKVWQAPSTGRFWGFTPW